MNISLGQIAFEAYSKAVGGKTYDGKPIPRWENLTNGDEARASWEAAARAVNTLYAKQWVNPKGGGL